MSYASAQTTVNEAQASGLQAFLTTWEGAGHVPYLEHRDQILHQTTNFLWWALDLSSASS